MILEPDKSIFGPSTLQPKMSSLQLLGKFEKNYDLFYSLNLRSGLHLFVCVREFKVTNAIA